MGRFLKVKGHCTLRCFLYTARAGFSLSQFLVPTPRVYPDRATQHHVTPVVKVIRLELVRVVIYDVMTYVVSTFNLSAILTVKYF